MPVTRIRPEGPVSRPLLHAAAAEDAGSALARAGRTRAGIDQLSTAFDTFMRCGASADARRIGQVLREYGVSRRVVSDLIGGRPSSDTAKAS